MIVLDKKLRPKLSTIFKQEEADHHHKPMEWLKEMHLLVSNLNLVNKFLLP